VGRERAERAERMGWIFVLWRQGDLGGGGVVWGERGHGSWK
jgi:hypothetical protein